MLELVNVVSREVELYNKQWGSNIRIIYKLHPLHSSKDPTFNLEEVVEACGRYNNSYVTTELDTKTLISKAKAVITINSTVGIEAPSLGKKVITLGNAFYNIEGIVTHCSSPGLLNRHVKDILEQEINQNLITRFLYYLRFQYFSEIFYLAPDKDSVKRLIDKIEKSIRRG